MKSLNTYISLSNERISSLDDYITEKLKIRKSKNINTFEDIITELHNIGLLGNNYSTLDFSKMSLKIDLFSTDNINFISLDNIFDLFETHTLNPIFEIEHQKKIREYRIKDSNNNNEFIILHYNKTTNDIEEITVSENIMKIIIDKCK
jgi:hypothetical protein